MVSKAFQVLSDGNKRAIFDQTGGDPDSRGGGGGAASPFSRGGGMGGGGGMHGFGADELSPEDLFRFFFNGGGGGFGGGGPFGGGGSPFGGGTFQFHGPGGVRMSAGGPRRAAGAGGGQQGQQQGSVWLQIAPLLLLFFFSLLFQLPSLFGGGSADPDFAFERMPKYSVSINARSTEGGKVSYCSRTVLVNVGSTDYVWYGGRLLRQPASILPTSDLRFVPT